MKWTAVFFLLLFAAFSNAQVRNNYTLQGEYEFSRGRYVSAIELLNKAIKTNQSNGRAYFFRGISKNELGDLSGVESDLTNAIKLNPKNHEAFLYRGVARSRSFRFKEAFEDFNQAVELDETDYRIYANRALASLHLERYVDVISDCNRVLDLKQDSSLAYMIRGEARAGLEMYRVAIQDFNRAIEIDTLSVQAILHRGIARAKLKEHDLAISDFNRALQMDTSNVLPMYHRGVAHAEMGHNHRALLDFDEVINRYPDNAAVCFNRAMLKQRMNRNTEALADFSQVIRLNPKNILGYFDRGNLKYNMGDKKGALADYDKAIILFPEFLQAHENRSNIYRQLGNRQEYQKAIQEIKRIKLALATGDENLKYRQLIKLMKLTELKGEFEPQEKHIGKIQYRKVDVRLLPIYRMTPFPDLNTDIRMYDGYGRPHYDMGIITLIGKQEAASEALITAKLAVAAKPNRAVIAHHFRGGLYLAMIERYTEAYARFDKVLRADSNHVVTYFARAIFRQTQLNHQQETPHTNAIITANYSDSLVSFAALSEADYRKVIALDKDMTYAYFNLGHLLSSTEKYEEAVAQFSLAINSSEDFIEAYYNRGLVRILLGETTTGCADMSRAGELGMTESYNIIKRYCE